MMTLQQLQVFCTVAEHLHFTRAAESLYLTQPAVTFHIRSLERDLGLRLLEVQGHKIHLTAAGEFLLQRATETLNAMSGIEREMHELAHLQGGWLRLGATITIGNYVVPEILAKFHCEHPHIQLSLEIANTACMERGLLARELDLALVEWRIDRPEIEVVPFQTDQLVVAVAPNHPLSPLAEVSAERLAEEPFVLRESGSGTRALMMESLGPVAEHLNIVLELDSPEAIKRCVRAGLGITIISETIIRGEFDRNEMVALRLAGSRMERQFSLAYLRSRPQSPAARAFAEFVLAERQARPPISKSWRNPEKSYDQTY